MVVLARVFDVLLDHCSTMDYLKKSAIQRTCILPWAEKNGRVCLVAVATGRQIPFSGAIYSFAARFSPHLAVALALHHTGQLRQMFSHISPM